MIFYFFVWLVLCSGTAVHSMDEKRPIGSGAPKRGYRLNNLSEKELEEKFDMMRAARQAATDSEYRVDQLRDDGDGLRQATVEEGQVKSMYGFHEKIERGCGERSIGETQKQLQKLRQESTQEFKDEKN